MNTVVPFLSSVISLAFALAIFDQYLARRRPYQLVWTLGLLTYFGATGCEFLTSALEINEVTYRLWYLLGAIFVAAYLGMGTLYLLTPRRVAHSMMILLAAASLYAIFKVFTVDVDLSVLNPGEVLHGKAFPQGVRLLTPVFNTFGSVALIGGALYSAWIFWRRRLMPHRVVSNILIAAGAFLPLLGGTFSRLGVPEFLYVLELLGIIVIFAGFLRSREVFGLYRFPLIHGWRRLPE